MEEATHADDDALLALLAPWFDLLQRDGAYLPQREPEAYWHAQDETSTIWLDHRMNDDVTDDPNTMEAVELLALLARVDWQLWQRAAQSIWPVRAFEFEQLFEARLTHVGVEWFLGINSGYGHSVNAQLVASRILPQSDAFLHAREAIQARLKSPSSGIPPVSVRLKKLQLDLRWARSAEVVDFLQEAFEVAAAPHAIVAARRDGGFAIQEIDFEVEGSGLDATCLYYLQEIVARHVWVPHLPPIEASVFTDSPELYIRSALRFYGFLASGNTASQRGASSTRHDLFQAREMLPAVYVALRQSPSLRTVEISNKNHDSTRETDRGLVHLTWQWIGFALFCREIGEPQLLEEVKINATNLRVHVVAAMKNGLKASDPLLQLLECSDSSNVVETVTASHFMLRDPDVTQTSFVVEKPLPNLRVVSRSSDWICILLPGWGRAHVHTDNVLASKAQGVQATRIASVPSMSFTDINGTSSASVLRLLKLVGNATYKVKAEWDETRTSKAMDEWCVKLLAQCPRLEDLELHRFSLDSLDVFVNGFASGKCRLQRLVLVSAMPDFDASFVDVLHAIGDKRHLASQYLRELVYEVQQGTVFVPEVFAAAIQMLEDNDRLLRFKLKFEDRPILEAESLTLRQCMEALLAFNKTVVSGYSSPIEKRQRLAFLSVVASRSAGYHAVGKLDTVLLVSIFQWLKVKRTRRVQVVFNGVDLVSPASWDYLGWYIPR